MIAVLRLHSWFLSVMLICVAVAVQWFAGQATLFVPLAAEPVRLGVLTGLVIAQAASVALWCPTPWAAWGSSRAGSAVTCVLGLACTGVLVGLTAVTAQWDVLAGWLGMAGLGWLGLAMTRDLATAWLVPVVLTLVNLVLPFEAMPNALTGVSVITWFGTGGLGEPRTWAATIAVAFLGLGLASYRVPLRPLA